MPTTVVLTSRVVQQNHQQLRDARLFELSQLLACVCSSVDLFQNLLCPGSIRIAQADENNLKGLNGHLDVRCAV